MLNGVEDSGKVLEAVRAGASSVPDIARATGIAYAPLQVILYSLEVTSLRREENGSGFVRYSLSKPDDAKPVHGEVQSVPPQAQRLTGLSEAARNLAIQQRAAPYCVRCQNLCLAASGGNRGLPHWQCRPCGETFQGSGEVDVAHIPESEIRPETEAEISAMIDRELGPEPSQDSTDDELCWCGRKREPGFQYHRGKHRSVAVKAEARNGQPSAKKEGLQGERIVIEQALETANGSVTKAAKLLGVSYQSLVYKIEHQHNGLLEKHAPVQRRGSRDATNEQLVTVGEPKGYQVKYEGVTILCDTQDEVVEIVTRIQGRATSAPLAPCGSAPEPIKLAWSKEFESLDPEGTTGLTYLYLISMLHDGMEQKEKDAVWTLVQYLKRIEAAVAASTTKQWTPTSKA